MLEFHSLAIVSWMRFSLCPITLYDLNQMKVCLFDRMQFLCIDICTLWGWVSHFPQPDLTPLSFFVWLIFVAMRLPMKIQIIGYFFVQIGCCKRDLTLWGLIWHFEIWHFEIWHFEAWTKWLTFSKQQFEIHFFKWKSLVGFKFYWSLFLKIQFTISQCWFGKWLVANRQQTITWTNVDQDPQDHHLWESTTCTKLIPQYIIIFFAVANLFVNFSEILVKSIPFSTDLCSLELEKMVISVTNKNRK